MSHSAKLVVVASIPQESNSKRDQDCHALLPRRVVLLFFMIDRASAGVLSRLRAPQASPVGPAAWPWVGSAESSETFSRYATSRLCFSLFTVSTERQVVALKVSDPRQATGDRRKLVSHSVVVSPTGVKASPREIKAASTAAAVVFIHAFTNRSKPRSQKDKDGREHNVVSVSTATIHFCFLTRLAFAQEEGDHHGARYAFSQARAIFTDRFGRNDPRARGAAAAAVAAQRMTAPPSPAVGRAFNARQGAAR